MKRKLFRYRSFDNEIVNDYSYIHQRMVNVEKWKFEAFEGLVYPSSPLYFNDPYDCEFCFQADTIDELLDRKEGGYSFFINEDDKKLYALKSRELNVEIEEKNNSYQEKEMEKMLEDVNSWGINVNKYVTEHRKVVPKSFISKMDPGRILTLIEQSNTENIEAFRYAINDLYSFSNISDFYMEDYENLKTIYEGIKPDDQQYDLIKKKNVELLKVIIGRKMELLRPKSIDGN